MATHYEAWQASCAVGRLFISQRDFGYLLLLQGPHIEMEQSIGGCSIPHPIQDLGRG